MISQSIPEFSKLDICDKAYVYIAYYFYSVKTEISLKSPKFDSVEVPLTIMLDSLESKYNKSHVNCKFFKWDAKIHYPTKLIFEDYNSILIDNLSSLRSINGVILSEEEINTLSKNTPTKVLNELSFEVSKKLGLEVEICKNIPNSEDIVDNILNPSFFYAIGHIYKDLLDNLYNMLYLLTHYVRVTWESLLEMTPVEMNILYKNFIEDKERQNDDKNNSSINMNDPNIVDSFGGF